MNASALSGVVVSLLALGTAFAFLYWRKDIAGVVHRMLDSTGERGVTSKTFDAVLSTIAAIVALGSVLTLVFSLNSFFR